MESLMAEKLAEMRDILLKMKEGTLAEIQKSVRSGTDSPDAEPSGDIYDQASSERDRELDLLLGDREREKLRSIDEALDRIDDGEYGICEECEEEIPLGRLKVLPFARYCVRCKADIEKLQAQTRRFEEERVYREIAFTEEEEA
jgi:DnaK suppressor protein